MIKDLDVGYDEIYTDDVCLFKCPSCGNSFDVMLTPADDPSYTCRKCKKIQTKESYLHVEEKRRIYVCKNCKSHILQTPGNITFDGRHYMCPRCNNFLAENLDFIATNTKKLKRAKKN